MLRNHLFPGISTLSLCSTPNSSLSPPLDSSPRFSALLQWSTFLVPLLHVQPFQRASRLPLVRLSDSKETLSWSPSFLQQQKCHPVSKLLRLLHVFSSNPPRPADSLKLPSASRYTLGTSQMLSGSEKMLLLFSQINHHTTVTVISQSPPLPSWSFQHRPQPFKSPPHQEDRGEGTVREFGMACTHCYF